MGRSSFSDESDAGSYVMGSIDLSAQNYDLIGGGGSGSGSSDESASQSTVCLTVEQYVYDDDIEI